MGYTASIPQNPLTTSGDAILRDLVPEFRFMVYGLLSAPQLQKPTVSAAPVSPNHGSLSGFRV